jgi:hypothetical protein
MLSDYFGKVKRQKILGAFAALGELTVSFFISLCLSLLLVRRKPGKRSALTARMSVKFDV